MTVRDRIREALRGAPDGLSRRQLHEAVDCNLGTLRQQISALVDLGEITVDKEDREYGETRVHKMADPSKS